MATPPLQFIGGPVDGEVRVFQDDDLTHLDVATMPPVYIEDTESERVEIDVVVRRHRYIRRDNTLLYRGAA